MMVDEARRHALHQLGVWMFLGTVTMLFGAFTSAYLVRRGGLDWQMVRLPSVLWVTTAVLAASSGTFELARRAARLGRVAEARLGMVATLLLGLGFLGGQLSAWQSLAGAGVLVQTHPHGAFFYTLTGVHALHLAAGLVLLVAALTRLWRLAPDGVVCWAVTASTAATFWHFLGGVWLYLFVLLSTR